MIYRENPIKMDDWGVPPFQETSISPDWEPPKNSTRPAADPVARPAGVHAANLATRSHNETWLQLAVFRK